MSKTIGEIRVRTAFNPDNLTKVDNLKQKSAALIDTVQELVAPDGATSEQIKEFNRLKVLAMTAYEEGAMWAVKAATS